MGNNTNPVFAESGASMPRHIDDKLIPVPVIAVETISQSINTETKAILGTYTFESLGAIKIGSFSQGVSGEIVISPNGISGKNVNGTTTFAIDGTTGNATFAGTIQAGSIISGQVIVGDSSIVIDGSTRRMVFYDDLGVPAILIGNG